MKAKDFEVIIIGGGAAGISAALWCDELGLSAVVLESKSELGGQLLWTYNPIKNYLGIEVETGRELQKIFLQQIKSRKLTLKTNSKVSQIEAEKKRVILENGEILQAQALIIATGIRRRKLNLENEEKFKGRGILTSGKRDAEKVKGKKVCVIGGGDAALENALILSEFAEKVKLIHRRQEFRARPEFVEKVRQHPKIEILTQAVVTKFLGGQNLEAIELVKNGESAIYPTDFLLLRLGVEPNTELVRGQITLDTKGYCRIDAHGETNLKNVYAIGDVANPSAPTISGAVGMGATAVKNLFDKQMQ
jgi:thioredoxin reductase (NADPH)